LALFKDRLTKSLINVIVVKFVFAVNLADADRKRIFFYKNLGIVRKKRNCINNLLADFNIFRKTFNIDSLLNEYQ